MRGTRLLRITRSRSHLLLWAAVALLVAAGLWAAGTFDPDSRLHHLSASLGGPVPHAVAPAGGGSQGTAGGGGGSGSDSSPADRAAVRRAEVAALRGGDHWTASWGTGLQPATPADPISERGFRRATLRELVFSSLGGGLVRVRFTNLYGRRPLRIARAAIALAGDGPDVAAGSSRKLSFGGHPNVTVAPGARVLSDPVLLDVPPLSRLSVSLYLPRATGPATQTAQSHETNWIASGSHILNAGGAFTRRTLGWFFVDGIEVLAPRRIEGSVAAIGDSITAGVGTGRNSDASWPDDLARRLGDLPGRALGVIDLGIGGNRVLNDASCCGPRAVQRFTPDVSGRARVRDVILLEGINDIGYSLKHDSLSAPHTDVTARQIIAGLKQIVDIAHVHRLRIFAGTLLPFKGARYWSPAGESKRELVNHWITTTRALDGFVDFARIMRDPAEPLRMNPAYDSGDHLHPNAAGYQAMANAIDLAELLARPRARAHTADRRMRAAHRGARAAR